MTRIAITGPLEGTGNYTIKAPVISTDQEIELPLSGTHLAGANSNGMPQLNDGTPIVESGSNSDGLWTRFANGTQFCSVRFAITSGYSPLGSVFATATRPFNWPRPFSESPDGFSCGHATGVDSGWCGLGDSGISPIDASLKSFRATTNGAVPVVSAMAHGKWE